MPWRKALSVHLNDVLYSEVMSLSSWEAAHLTEIRVRVHCPIQFVFTDGNSRTGAEISGKEMEELTCALCRHSKYAFEGQMAQGYIPLCEGHRAGICGRVVYENGRIVRMSEITSVCIRIARAVQAASAAVRRYLFCRGRPARVLFLGPPGSGKTTVLRDAAMYLARECRLRVAAADEREELFAQTDCPQIDVLRGAGKRDAVTMLVRTMSPQVIVCDEIGAKEDADALMDAVSCGVGVLASAHADGLADLMKRPALCALYRCRAFDWYVLLASMGNVAGVIDTDGKEGDFYDGKLGNGADGLNRDERCRIFTGGRRKTKDSMDPGDAALPAQA